MRLRYVLHLWFGFSIPVSRAAYLTTGCALMGGKYVIESLVVYLGTGQVWTPQDYLIPSVERYTRLVGSESPLAWGLAAWSLPFIWIGASMTTRRAVNAGISAAWGLLFFVPIVNDLTMLVLAALPTAPARPSAGVGPGDRSPKGHSGLRSAALGVLLGTALAAAMTGLATLALGRYSSVLFVGTPFVMGFVAGGLYNRDAERSIAATIGIVFATMLAASGVVLLLAMEGAICLAMAFPLALVLGIVGALLGRVTGRERRLAAAPFALLLIALPALLGFSGRSTPPLREVVSHIDVAAPPAAVWDNVIAFGELPPPDEWEFRRGIAYPIRARIDGAGIGALRHCEFSTGAFVEPITTWEPGRRLSFDVRDQPPTMRELSPYEQVRAPHLSGYLRSHRGEFRLAALPDGGTRLEGSTFYTLDIHPGWYWSRFTDRLIARIHMRVLRHIKALSETGG